MTGPNRRLRTAVLGATGTVGQRFVTLLADHSWFELSALAASERSAGKLYRDAVTWIQTRPIDDAVADMPVHTIDELMDGARRSGDDFDIVFSALDASVARDVEPRFARRCLVVTNASAHRMDADVPLLVPEVNPDHLTLLPPPGDGKALPAGIVANPNCSTIGLVLALKPLADAFGFERISVVTLQAVSGAGLPGISSYQILDNVIPWISSEEEKLEIETGKILGEVADGTIDPAEVAVSAQCNRVPVVDGHTLCVSVDLKGEPAMEDVREAWRSFRAEPQERGLPSAPAQPTVYLGDDEPPQARVHRDLGQGNDDLRRQAAGVSDPRLPLRRPLAQHPAGRRRRGAARRRAGRRPLRATDGLMANPVRAFAPASVSNIACGFDILGFALQSEGDDDAGPGRLRHRSGARSGRRRRRGRTCPHHGDHGRQRPPAARGGAQHGSRRGEGADRRRGAGRGGRPGDREAHAARERSGLKRRQRGRGGRRC